MPTDSQATIELLGRSSATFQWSHAEGDVIGYEVYESCGQGEVPVDFEPEPTQIIEVADFNGDGAGNFNNSTEDDVLWRNRETGETLVWYMDENLENGFRIE